LPRRLRLRALDDGQWRVAWPRDARARRRAGAGVAARMSLITLYVPGDAGAVSVGADAVARALEAEATRRGRAVRIVRNGSRGLYWLEPLVEVVTSAGRIAYGPVQA